MIQLMAHELADGISLVCIARTPGVCEHRGPGGRTGAKERGARGPLSGECHAQNYHHAASGLRMRQIFNLTKIWLQRHPWFVACLLAAGFFLQAFCSSEQESLTWDEPSYISAGYA